MAWLIERFVLRQLVNQEAHHPVDGHLGITYFLDGLGQTVFGSDIYKIDIGMPKEPLLRPRSTFEGGVLLPRKT